MAVGVLGLVLLQAIVPGVAASPAQASPAQPLADRIEIAFRACTFQVTDHQYLTARHGAELQAVGIVPTLLPPTAVAGVGTRAFGADALYAQVDAPDGNMWLAAAPGAPACKVLVADTALGFPARELWAAKLRRTSPWGFDQDGSGMRGTVLHQLFVLNPERAGAHMVVTLDGPNAVWKDGQDIQLIVTVAVEPAKAQ